MKSKELKIIQVSFSLRLKLILSFLFVALMVGITSLLLVYNDKVLQKDFDRFISVNMEEIEYSSQAAYWIQRTKSNFREMMLETIIDTKEDEIAHAQKSIKNGLSNLQSIGKHWLKAVEKEMSLSIEDNDMDDDALSEAEELEEVKELIELIDHFNTSSLILLDRYSQSPQNHDKHHDYFEDKIEPISRQLQDSVNDLWQEVKEETQMEKALFEQILNKNITIALWSSFLSIILATLLGLFFSRRLINRLEKLRFATEKIESGNFDIEIDSSGNDELALLSSKFISMRDNLKRNIDAREKTEKQLTSAIEIAEKATQSKSNFLATMSHEIRTPMNAIIGLTGLLLKSRLKTKQFNYANKIARSSRSLLHIINDILDVSKIEAGKMALEHIPFHLDEIVNHLGELFITPCVDKGNELNLWIMPNCPCALVGDPVRLEQVLLNLIGNANKFTSGGEVEVRISFTEEEKILFLIRDTGIGIEEDKISSLFKPFTQADGSITRKYGGTGLGLSISDKLINQMGGQLQVTSQVGLGSQFFFSLDFEQQESHKRCEQALPPELQNKKVLVIDDNQTAIDITRTILESFKLEVEGALSGPIALNLIQKQLTLNKPNYDIIVLDWLMPEMNGIVTAEKILSLYSPEHLPFILIQTIAPEDPEIINFTAQHDNCFLLSKPIKRFALCYYISKAYGYEVDEEKQEQYLQNNYDFYREQLVGQRVLLVEDNLLNQEVATDVLESVGIEVILAENGQLAIDIVNEQQSSRHPVDLVLMDLQMPIMDGLTASRLLRANKQYHDLPIIALTAHVQDENREDCFDAGMNDFLTKPFDAPDLYKKLIKQLIFCRHIQVLVVEDNPINQEILGDMMDDLGMVYDIAEIAGKAITLFRQKSYQLVFMDLQLPDMDGFQATKLIRDVEQSKALNKPDNQKQVPIIAISASTMAEDKNKALEYTMNDYLPKPFSLEQLQELVLKWVNVRKSSNSAQVLPNKIDNQQVQESKKQIIGEQPKPEKDKINAILDHQIITKLQLKPKLLSRIAKIYLDTTPAKLDELLDAINEKDMQQITDIAHPFKSSSKHMGAVNLAEKLNLIESQGRNGELAENIQTLMQEIQKEHRLVIVEVKKLM